MRTAPICLRAVALALLVCASGLSPADAQAKEPEAVEQSWRGHADEAVVIELARSYGVDVVHSKHWRDGELAEFLRGVELLPARLRERGDRRIKLERSPRACMFGLGRYTRTCPTFDKDEETFYLYSVAPGQGEGSARTLGALDMTERARLWRRRAAIHLFVSLYDQEHEWSLRRRWRSINGWNARGDQSFNIDTWGFSRYLGRQSAHFDLVTFAEEFFARPEDILADSSRPGAKARLAEYDWNISLACQEFTKVRIFGRYVAQIEPTWIEPSRGPVGSSPVSMCTEFERWADVKNVEGVDFLLAAATSDRPESLYGHLLLGVRYKDDASVRSSGFEPVFQYGAITDTNVSKIEYFTKGLFGGFPSIIQPNTFRGVDRLFNQYEQRTLRRYGFNLSPKQKRQVMQRLWEAERHITYPYYFMSDNCASMLIDLILPAIDDIELPAHVRFALMPTEVVDLFASVENGDRGQLLIKRTETHFSSREIAMDAVPGRRGALEALSDALEAAGADTQKVRALAVIDERLDRRDPQDRERAYKELTEALVELLKRHGAAKPDEARAVTMLAIDYLYFSTRIERYFMDLAFYHRRLIYAGALESPPTYTIAEQLQMRRDLYEVEDLQKRQEAMLALAKLSDRRLREGKRREFNQKELDDLAAIERVQAAYLASLDALATTIETFVPELDGVSYIDGKVEVFETEQLRRDQLAMGPPGKGRYVIGVSGGLVSDGSDLGEPVGWGELSASLIYERLGEQRRRGFRPDIQSRALGLDAEFKLGEDIARNLKVDLTLFEFMSVEQRLGPVRRNWRDAFGWGIKVGADHDGRRGMDLGLAGEIGYLYPVWTRDNVSSFFVVGAMAALRTDWGRAQDPEYLGAKAFLLGQLHLYGRYANVIRFSAETYQYARLDGIDHYWDARARVQTEHVLADINQQLLLLQPYVQYEFTELDYREDANGFSNLRAGLRLELPF